MDIIQAFKERRSINFFQPNKEIPEEKLKQLLEIANLSPSSFNLQPWQVIVVKNPEKKKILKKCAFNQEKVEEASVDLIIIADPDAVEKNIDKVLKSWEELGYITPGKKETIRNMALNLYGSPDSTKRKIFAVKNASLYAMSIMLAAKGLGLETHPMDGMDEECIKKEFNIPENKIVIMIIAVGYLKEGVKLLPRAWRRNINEFVKFV